MNIETANRLVQLRKENGYSQEVLAEKLGISRRAISKWERAEASPDTDNTIALAGLYGMTLDALLNTADDKYIPANTPQSQETAEKEEKLPKTERQLWGKRLACFPFPLFVVAAYLAGGFTAQLWHPGWIIFLLIPLYYQTASALAVRSVKTMLFMLPIPELVTILYLLGGFLLHLWHPGWIIFLVLPLYYWAVGALYKETKKE